MLSRALVHCFCSIMDSMSVIALPLEPSRCLPLLLLALSHQLSPLAALMLFSLARLGVAVVLRSFRWASLSAHSRSPSQEARPPESNLRWLAHTVIIARGLWTVRSKQ